MCAVAPRLRAQARESLMFAHSANGLTAYLTRDFLVQPTHMQIPPLRYGMTRDRWT